MCWPACGPEIARCSSTPAESSVGLGLGVAGRCRPLDLAVAVGETQVKRVDIVQFLDALSDQGQSDQGVSDQGKDRHIFLRADRTVPYGELMDVLERLRIGGYHKIALVALEGVPDDSMQRAAPAAKP